MYSVRVLSNVSGTKKKINNDAKNKRIIYARQFHAINNKIIKKFAMKTSTYCPWSYGLGPNSFKVV